ncbi:hypothetical protein EJ06DRAFT_529643 [Trichodelitschia bisporula]|uniref:Uncharacterized protein n=1 Tax=Trichodelitschia bisporula TaxID=703511 RepID=A0A6G1I0E2_9PEZI|nr:hypothetical protein EJ06DRAFT_529643 [Trichodelitschia bisporula]
MGIFKGCSIFPEARLWEGGGCVEGRYVPPSSSPHDVRSTSFQLSSSAPRCRTTTTPASRLPCARCAAAHVAASICEASAGTRSSWQKHAMRWNITPLPALPLRDPQRHGYPARPGPGLTACDPGITASVPESAVPRLGALETALETASAGQARVRHQDAEYGTCDVRDTGMQ